MQTYSWRAAAGLSLALTTCGGSPGVAGEGTTDSPSTTGAPTSTTTADEPTTTGSTGTGSPTTTGEPATGTTGEPTSTTTGSSSTTDTSTGTTGEPCPTPLCGDPAVCCQEGELCKEGACTSTCGLTGGQKFLDVEVQWSWPVDEVTVTPLVADITGDEVPEVVVVASRIDGVDRELGEIVVLSGDTGTELWRLSEDPQKLEFGAFGRATPVLADVNGDQRPDIVYYGRHDDEKLGRVHAVDGTGALLWTGHTADDLPVRIHWDHGAAVATNFDDDPEAEIVVGGAIFDHDGLLVWNQDDRSGELGTPTDNKDPPKLLLTGSLATVADLTGDGKPELITGREAWTVAWTPGAPPTVALTQLWKNSDGKGNDGWPAVADIDMNGTPEVVLVAWPDIKVLDGATGKLWCGVDPTGVLCQDNDALRTPPIAIEGLNLGGPAVIADLDGDGRPEVGIAGGTAFAVYDFNRTGEDIVLPKGDPPPAAGAMYVRWWQKTQDGSTGSTGASAFDFQGDGTMEVTYQDECRLHVFDGPTGAPKLALNNSSSTVHEYPVVVDADGDGHAELLVVASPPGASDEANCVAKFPNHTTRKGVFMYRSGTSEWVPTRKLWTQHTYHVTNAESTGNVPAIETNNWAEPQLNDFRRNVQGACE